MSSGREYSVKVSDSTSRLSSRNSSVSSGGRRSLSKEKPIHRSREGAASFVCDESFETGSDNSEVESINRQRVEQLFQSAILRSGKKKDKCITSLDAGIFENELLTSSSNSSEDDNNSNYLDFNILRLKDQSEEFEENLDILIPKHSEPSEEESSEELIGMLQMNKKLRNNLDSITREKYDLEEQFVNQVLEMEKLLSRQPPTKTRRSSISSRHFDESRVSSALQQELPRAEDSPIVKLSKSILQYDTSPNSVSVDPEGPFHILREKIEEIKTRYELEKEAEKQRYNLTQEIGFLVDKILKNDRQNQHSERVQKISNSLKEYMSIPDVSPGKQGVETLQKEIKDLKAENAKLRTLYNNERKSRKTYSKNLAQSESFIERLEDQHRRKETRYQQKLESMEKMLEEVTLEKDDLIGQVQFLRESLETSHNLSLHNVEVVSTCSTSRLDEPVQDIVNRSTN